jgi:type I restriction-modification system DNA methylase subunit
MTDFYVRETGIQFCVEYEREYYTDIDDNQKLLSKKVDYINYEMLYDIEKIVRNDQNLTDQELAEKVKKYLQKC